MRKTILYYALTEGLRQATRQPDRSRVLALLVSVCRDDERFVVFRGHRLIGPTVKQELTLIGRYAALLIKGRVVEDRIEYLIVMHKHLPWRP